MECGVSVKRKAIVDGFEFFRLLKTGFDGGSALHLLTVLDLIP